MGFQMKGKYSLVFKIIISISLIAFLIYRADWVLIAGKLKSVGTLLIGFIVLMAIVSIVLSSIKWKILLSINGIQIKFPKLVKYYFIAMFFNNFLPTRIGGDLYRIYKTYNNPESKTGAIVAVATERLTGVFAITLMGTIAGIISYNQGNHEISGITALIGAIAISTSTLAVILIYYGKLGTYLQGKKFIPEKAKMAINNLREYTQKPFHTSMAFAVSFMFYLAMIIKFAVLFFGISEECSVISITVVLLVSNVISMIPLSLNGIGLLEGSFIVAIQVFGVHYDSALTVMLINRSVIMLVSLVGAIFYMLDSKNTLSIIHPPPCDQGSKKARSVT
jgi:glycosyltransferase 2 family protein